MSATERLVEGAEFETYDTFARELPLVNIMWSDKNYMKCFLNWTADLKSRKLWSSQLWTQLKQLRIEAWKSQDFNGVWTRDLAILVRCSNQLSYEATVSEFIPQLVRKSHWYSWQRESTLILLKAVSSLSENLLNDLCSYVSKSFGGTSFFNLDYFCFHFYMIARNCSVCRESCHDYSPKMFGSFARLSLCCRKKLKCYSPA